MSLSTLPFFFIFATHFVIVTGIWLFFLVKFVCFFLFFFWTHWMATGMPDVDDIQVNERRRLSKSKKTFGFNEPLPKKCWSSRLVRDWKWQLTDVGSQTLNPSVLPVKHFDIWRGLVSFSFNFSEILFIGREGIEDEKWRHFPRRRMTEDDWLRRRKIGKSQTWKTISLREFCNFYLRSHFFYFFLFL